MIKIFIDTLIFNSIYTNNNAYVTCSSLAKWNKLFYGKIIKTHGTFVK